MSLDKFAYAKDLEAVTDEIKPEPAITSSKRTVLADCSPPNYKPDETFNQRQDEKINSKKENYGDVLKDDENRQKDISCLTRDVNADYSDATLVWPKSTTIGKQSLLALMIHDQSILKNTSTVAHQILIARYNNRTLQLC